MIAVVLGPFLLAFVAPLVPSRLGKASGWLLATLPALSTAYFAAMTVRLSHGGPSAAILSSLDWVPELGARLSFRADGLSVLMGLLISGIGTLVVIYAGSYLAGDARLGRFYLFLLMFMGSMLGVVLADNLILLFVFWELTSLSSYFLIGFSHEEAAARKAALQALLVTGGGGLCLLAGLVLVGQATGHWELTTLLTVGGSQANFTAAMVLILLGAFTKSAQVPFHFWLPGAMQAPTPVSAYLHSATMVKAGVYLIARLSPIFAGAALWEGTLVAVGALTMLTGAVLAIAQTDLKRLLAYSTVSALGTLIFLLGLGTPLAVQAGVVFLLVHSLYKGALFLLAGALDHETGTRDVTRLGGLLRAMPKTAGAALLAALSMAGVPLLAGFVAKELLYEAALKSGAGAAYFTAAAVLSNALGVAVAAIVGLLPFFARPGPSPDEAVEVPHDPPPAMLLGPLVLSSLGLLLGCWPGLANRIVEAAGTSVLGRPIEARLALWHGFTPMLALSLVTLLLGVSAIVAIRFLRRSAEGLRPLSAWGPERGYDGALSSISGLASWQTRVLQSGLLRRYVLVLAVVTTCGVGLVFFSTRVFAMPDNATVPLLHEVVLLAVIAISALAVVRSHSRLAAIAALGAVGYGVALVFLLFGAPDLAMTQFAIETLSVILFVLVLGRLPRFKAFSKPSGRLRDALVAVGLGGLITSLMLSVLSQPLKSRLAGFFAESSLALANGRNVVNVILVDFRGFDTLGEITVLAAAAIGVFSLVRLRPRAKDTVEEP